MALNDRRRFVQTAGALAVGALAPAVQNARAESTATPAKFRLGLVTYNVAANWDLETLLTVCGRTSISPVELRTTHKHGVEPSLTSLQRKEVRRRFTDAGIEIWGCGTTCEFHSPDKTVVQRQIETCKMFIDLVADLGGRGVKVRPNQLPRGVPASTTLEQIGQALVRCGEAAAAANIEIWVEVHGPGTSEPENMKKIMEFCGHKNVGITWNSNPTDIKNGSVAASFEMLWPWIRSCHINEIYKDSTGKYPYRELFGLLRRKGYDRATLIEVGRSMPDAASGEELLRYYKALWSELTREFA